ncbi:MAG: type IV pilus assembly protein PilM [Patescibacteria group bacterium]
MFIFPQKPGFGLDLSNLSLKLAQIKKKNGDLSLVSFVKEDIPQGVIEEGEIKKDKELAIILKNALKKVKGESLNTPKVVCNLPEEKIFIRVIQLPKMKEEELEQAVHWEAEAHIPLGIDEVYLGFQVIKPMVNHLDHLDVLIAATPRPLVDKYLSCLKQSGLEPIALEPESLAVVRSLIAKDELKPSIIVDLGATGTNFVIYSAQAIRFTSHIRISGQMINQTIAENLKVSLKEAEQLKIKVGLDKTQEKGKIYQSLEPVINDLAKQIKDYILFYQEHATHVHGPDGAIAQVVLCGGDSLLTDLPSVLAEKINLPVKIGDPLINLSEKKASIKIPFSSKKEILAYTTAIGLALRDFI